MEDDSTGQIEFSASENKIKSADRSISQQVPPAVEAMQKRQQKHTRHQRSQDEQSQKLEQGQQQEHRKDQNQPTSRDKPSPSPAETSTNPKVIQGRFLAPTSPSLTRPKKVVPDNASIQFRTRMRTSFFSHDKKLAKHADTQQEKKSREPPTTSKEKIAMASRNGEISKTHDAAQHSLRDQRSKYEQDVHATVESPSSSSSREQDHTPVLKSKLAAYEAALQRSATKSPAQQNISDTSENDDNKATPKGLVAASRARYEELEAKKHKSPGLSCHRLVGSSVRERLQGTNNPREDSVLFMSF